MKKYYFIVEERYDIDLDDLDPDWRKVREFIKDKLKTN